MFEASTSLEPPVVRRLSIRLLRGDRLDGALASSLCPACAAAKEAGRLLCTACYGRARRRHGRAMAGVRCVPGRMVPLAQAVSDASPAARGILARSTLRLIGVEHYYATL